MKTKDGRKVVKLREEYEVVGTSGGKVINQARKVTFIALDKEKEDNSTIASTGVVYDDKTTRTTE